MSALCLVALSSQAAVAQKVMNTDVYIAVQPAEGEEFFPVYYGPRDFVLVPTKAFGANGIASYDAKMEGASALKEKIEQAFTDANKQFAAGGVKFEIRNIYFIRADQKDIKSHYNAEDAQLTLDVDKKTGKSGLLADFKKAATGKDSFNILMGDLKESSEGEPGRGEEPGNTSVISLTSVIDPLNKGQILVHEFGHNLGLEHKNYSKADALKHGMSANLPDRRPGQPAVNKSSDPKLTAEETQTIKTRIGKGLYDAYIKKPVKTSQYVPPTQTQDQQTALSIPASNSPPFSGSPPQTNEIVTNGFEPVGFNPLPDPVFDISGGAFTGQLDRQGTWTLGTEFGGNISLSNLVEFDNDASTDGFFFNATADTTALDNVLWGDFFQLDPGTTVRTGFFYEHLESDVNQQIGLVDVGAGNSLLIFSPVGVNGGLAGGLNAGPRNAENLVYSNSYERDRFRLTKEVGFNSGPVELSPIGWIGYGQTDINETIMGDVQGINQSFSYYNVIDVDTFSFGGGLNVQAPVGQVGNMPVDAFGSVAAEIRFHEQNGHSRLMLDGIVNATETQNLGGSDTNGAFEANAGFNLGIAPSLDLEIGARFRYSETPGVVLEPQQEARIEWDGATEIIAYAAIKAGFGTGGGDVFASDRRLKHDVVQIATLPSGVKLYSFKYLWDETDYIGVMAQDLLADPTLSNAVRRMQNGFYAVDYRKLGLRMATLETWRALGTAAILASPVALASGDPVAPR